MNQAVSVDPNHSVREWLSDLIARAGLPGIASAGRLGDAEISAAAGLSSSRGGTAISVTQRLPISCVMKALVALVVLHGHETGVLDCDSDISSHLPALSGPQGGDTGITIRHLLTHTAGYIEPQENSARWGYTWERFVDFFPHRKQAFEPGAVWSYCHTGYVLLQKAAEAAYGRGIDDLLEELIFDHLEFRPENFNALPAGTPDAMSLHVRSPRSGFYEPMRPPMETGFLRYSISDLALSVEQLTIIGQALAGGCRKLAHLEPARRRLLSSSIGLPTYISGEEGERIPIGFCHGVADYGAFRGVNGSYVGATCAIRFDEHTGASLATALNAWAPYARDAAAAYVGRRFAMTRSTVTPRPAPVFDDLSILEGEYEGLMIGTANAGLVGDGDSLVCTVNRKGLPPLHGRVARRGDGRLALVQGAREITLALFKSPDGDEPIMMVGTSACRKLRS